MDILVLGVNGLARAISSTVSSAVPSFPFQVAADSTFEPMVDHELPVITSEPDRFLGVENLAEPGSQFRFW